MHTAITSFTNHYSQNILILVHNNNIELPLTIQSKLTSLSMCIHHSNIIKYKLNIIQKPYPDIHTIFISETEVSKNTLSLMSYRIQHDKQLHKTNKRMLLSTIYTCCDCITPTSTVDVHMINNVKN